MSIYIKTTLLSSSILMVSSAYALPDYQNKVLDCWPFQSFKTDVVTASIGVITVQPKAKIGDILRTINVPIPLNNSAYKCNKAGRPKFYGELLNFQTESKTGGSDVYKTNVDGIGIRVTHESRNYPVDYTGTYINAGDLVYFKEPRVRIEVIKTAALSDTGDIRRGNLAKFFIEGNPIDPWYRVELVGDNTIISPTCEVQGYSRDQTVELKPVQKSLFKKFGSTVGGETFYISLSCSGGGVSGGAGTGIISLKFNFDTDGNASVLKNTAAKGATGVGLQIFNNSTNNKNVVQNDKAIEVMRTVPGDYGKRLSVPFIVKYYQTKSTVTGGAVEARATFEITYR